MAFIKMITALLRRVSRYFVPASLKCSSIYILYYTDKQVKKSYTFNNFFNTVRSFGLLVAAAQPWKMVGLRT